MKDLYEKLEPATKENEGKVYRRMTICKQCGSSKVVTIHNEATNMTTDLDWCQECMKLPTKPKVKNEKIPNLNGCHWVNGDGSRGD